MTASPASAEVWRRDAQRNWERILASGRTLLARDGLGASVEEITRQAGVGMGTLYRHFPTKEQLIDAVLEDALAELVRVAEQAVAEADAWRGLTRFLEQALDLHSANSALLDLLATRDHGGTRGAGDAGAHTATVAPPDRAGAGAGRIAGRCRRGGRSARVLDRRPGA